jgi:predicted helicase
MVRYFELDTMLSLQYDAVWRWIDWPDRQGKPDTGIDLVAHGRDSGSFTAIQCKSYEPTHTLSKADIDAFFSASGKAHPETLPGTPKRDELGKPYTVRKAVSAMCL